MANGLPPSGSRAPYIIICNGRISLALAKSGFEMIQVASRTATALVSYYGDKVTDADTKPISALQHKMMDLVNARKVTLDSGDMVDEMFTLLDALEQRMSS